MRVAAVVLGRLSSARLPGKVLRDVAGRPLLQRVLDRLQLADGIDVTLVATSDAAADDPLAAWCAEHGVACFRGALDDVAGRVLAAAEHAGADAIARINADSPWLDPTLLTRAVATLRTGEHDLVTNVAERTWPYGVSAEAFTVDALRRARTGDPDDAEHVTRAFYRLSSEFKVTNLRADPPLDTDLRLTVDTEDDLVRAIQLATALGPRAATAGTPELCEIAQQLP